MNDLHEHAPANDWRRRTSTRVAVCLLSWWACGASYAVDFPSQPLQTGASQPAPNVIFILDDSLSMTTQNSQNGDELDTRMTFSNTDPAMGGSENPGYPYTVPYTKNPLSYDPHTVYLPWAKANSTDTKLERLPAASYTSASNSDQYYTGGTTNLSSKSQTFYVPKTDSSDKTDQRQYYRYQIYNDRLIRAEWTDAAPAANFAMTTVKTWNNITGVKQYWGNNSGGTPSQSNGNLQCTSDTNNFRFDVPAGVTRIVITTTGATGASSNPELYVRSGNKPCYTPTSNYTQRSINSAQNDERVTIDDPAAGTWYFGVYNSASGSGTKTFANVTLTVQTSTVPWLDATLGCSEAASGTYGWKNCVDITTTGDANNSSRALAAEKQNYANWFAYHRTRMKIAKAGGSEAFASLDQNYRVGIMGLYPYGSRQQVLGSTSTIVDTVPTAADPGNLTNIIPVDTDGGLFVGANRVDWFTKLHGMAGKQYTPLRKALDAAGKYYSSERAYKSKTSTGTTYLACRQNFTILTTDGYWNNFGGSDDPDSDYEGDKISGDEEPGKKIIGPPKNEYTYAVGPPYWYNAGDKADTTTLADIAMNYWKTDLRTEDVASYPGSAENRVPTSTSNPAFWQHMVTFSVGLGVRGSLTDDQVKAALAGDVGAYWPAPKHETGGTENPQNVDDLRHAAFNSRGSFLNANNAKEFADGITDALTRIGERRGSASNVLANSTSISTDSFIYQATYTAGTWHGELLAYPISKAGLTEPKWRAGELIPTYDARNILTANGASGGSTFPNSTQKSELDTLVGSTLSAYGLPDGTALANYLKGDATYEERNKGKLRDRTMRYAKDDSVGAARLGDIVDSSPFYVADSQTVFVGANDGMLHAFDATNTSTAGTERFAYIPRGVAMSQLAELADPLYGTNTTNKPHRFFVDGPLVVSSRARTPGVNYLIGALGRGGRGVYGLDVTNPGSFGASNVKWDLTGDSAPDGMGNVIAEPLISKLNSDETAAVVANGPNSKGDKASLFILSLSNGSTIRELTTDATTGNGLSAPRAVDVNADGKVDFFFAGDLKGNLWRFNVSDKDSSKWAVDKVFSSSQPISSAPGVARDPTNGKIWVFFGTGRYMTSADQSDTSTYSYYGIVVGTGGTDGTGLGRSSLDPRTIQVTDAKTGQRAFQPAAVGIDASKSGWYIDLNKPKDTGERVISAPLIYNNILIFSSIVPPSATTVNSCDSGGSGYLNALDAFSGTSLAAAFFVKIPAIKDGTTELPVGSLPINAGMPTAPIIIGDQLVVGDSSGGKPTNFGVNAPGGSATRRVSWRELLNDQ
jgi:type IV pilus assembly protein PilY1